MFAVISRGRPGTRQTYICSSCIKSLQPHSPFLLGEFSSTAWISTIRIRHRSSDADKPQNKKNQVLSDGVEAQSSADKISKNAGGRARKLPGKSSKPATKHQKRMIERRKESLQKLRESIPDAPFKLLLKLYRAELAKKSAISKSNRAPRISQSESTLAALKASMLDEDAKNQRSYRAEKMQGTQPSGKGPERDASKSTKEVQKKAKSKSKLPTDDAKGSVELVKDALVSRKSKARSKSTGLPLTSDPNYTNPKKKQSTSKSKMTGGDEVSKVGMLRKSSKTAMEKPIRKIPSALDTRKISKVNEGGKNAANDEDLRYTPSVKNQDWAKNWVKTIASNQDGGSKFKRAILVELIEKGNLSPEDVNPAIALLRNALQEVKKNEETQEQAFLSLKQAMQGGSLPKLKIQSPIKRRTVKSAGKSDPLEKVANQEIMTVNASDLKLTPLDVGPLKVPTLSYGLERVLFNPGVYQLQDPRSRVFNFDPYLQTIMPVNEFDFSALKQYVTSSKDTTLLDIAKQEKKKYTGSTSSMTSMLAHFHFLLSQWRPINTKTLSKDFPAEHENFTQLQRGPSAIFLRYKEGTYAIDADKEFDTANILSSLGKSMEKLLTLPRNDFERYRKQNSSQITEEERNEDEAFHYTSMGDFLMRSQLDAYDPRLPGTGMFDLKTRAVVAIRMDVGKYEEGSGYEIKNRFGEWESYEREYYDMIRAAFLKYSLQVRMGRMDGIFVAFHNTERIFGFQYVSLSEMDYAIHGTTNMALGDAEFKVSVDLLNRVLDRATAKYPEKSIRLFFETRDTATPFMYIFAEPVEEGEIDKIQTTNKAGIEEFESRVLGLTHEETERQEEWDSLRSIVEQEIDRDEVEPSGNRSDSEVWDAETRKRVEEFVAAVAQEPYSQDNEDEDVAEEEEAEEEDESGLAAVEEEQSGDSTQLVEDRDEIADTNDLLSKDQEEYKEEDVSVEEASDDESLDDAEQFVDDTLLTDQDEDQPDELSAAPTVTMESSVDNNSATLTHEDPLESFVESHDSQLGIPAISDNDVEEGANREEDTDLTGNSNSILGAAPPTDEIEKKGQEMMAMTLTIRNKVNGQYVKRPTDLEEQNQWAVEYHLKEIENPERTVKLYEAAKARRGKTLSNQKKANKPWNAQYIENLMQMSRKGRAWRQEIEAQEKDTPKKVLVIGQVKPEEQANHTE